MLNSCISCKTILKISKTKGLRTPKRGCVFEPFFFASEGNETRVHVRPGREDRVERTGAGAPPMCNLTRNWASNIVYLGKGG